MNEFQSQGAVTGYFDRVAKEYLHWYDLPTPEGHSFRIRKQRCLEMLASLPSGSSVLDVGCGPATMTRELVDRGFMVTGTDIAPQMIEACKQHFAHEPRVQFLAASADRTPLPDESQNAVTALGLIEYLNDEAIIFREFHRLLKPGGLMVISFPNYTSPVRVWDRFTHRLAKPILRLIKHRQTSGVKHREYKLTPTLEMIRQADFEIEQVLFYNFKLGFRPLDKLFPRLVVKIAASLEGYAETPILRNIGTGFLVLARRR